MTTTAPPVDSRVIGLAHYAARGVLEHVLSRHGVTFAQQITLRSAVADGPLGRESLVGRVVGALKTDPAGVHAVIGELLAKGLLAAEGESIRATGAGRALHDTVNAETAPISARIYAGISAEDRAVAGRVLARITERADAELAAMRPGGPAE
ncbi:MarR family transcriptional regulator [Streptomyces phaeoluteigriseus]|uniref:MarR family transcriptional regulator n=1 Tax=Streptomyces phaeoluteigriseus TaxID=114686 RepID=A0A1V6MLH6_9ACTN|nr:MarR family transcriptional regulator [Streptomyces phaeoluteigriseus]OQD53186.1 MarR family transcriptional regulator [Streptomyces phaeoluteigriseus]